MPVRFDIFDAPQAEGYFVDVPFAQGRGCHNGGGMLAWGGRASQCSFFEGFARSTKEFAI
jgi:hypothetical protein